MKEDLKCPPGKHAYEARYDETVSSAFGAVMDGLKDKIYVCDVCTKCGDKIERQRR